MALIQIWPGIGLNVRKENSAPGVYYSPAEYAEHTTYVQRRLDQGDLFEYDPNAPPAYIPFIDEQSVFIGRTAYQLRDLRGHYTGAVTTTTGRATAGDNLGAVFRWDAASATADNGTTVFGSGATGRWIAAGTVDVSAVVLTGLQVTELSTTPGSGDGEVKYCNGYASAGDGGCGEFSWASGVSAGANGFTKINATGGQWQLLTNSGELNIAQLGCLPDGSDCSTRLQAIIDHFATVGTKPTIELYAPKGARSYRFSTALLPPSRAVGNQPKRLIIRGDRGEGAGQEAYGNSAYASTTFYSGTSLQFDSGVVGFDCHQSGDKTVALTLRNLCLQGAASGSKGVYMGPGTVPESVVRFDSENLTVAGFETGIDFYTYQPSRHPGLRTFGCSTHVKVTGTATCWISDSEHQGGADAFLINKCLNFSVSKFMIQGISGAAVKVADIGAGSILGCDFDRGHIETVGKVIADNAANVGKSVRISFTRVYCNGDAVANAVTLYGTGWDFFRSYGGLVVTQNAYAAAYDTPDNDLTVTLSGSAAARLRSNNAQELCSIGLQNGAVPIVSGNVTPDGMTRGSNVIVQLTANVTLKPPTNMPFGQLIFIQFQQDAIGGWTVTPDAGLGLGSEWTLSMTGNVANSRAWAICTRDTNGGTVGQQMRLIHWSGWRV